MHQVFEPVSLPARSVVKGHDVPRVGDAAVHTRPLCLTDLMKARLASCRGDDPTRCGAVLDQALVTAGPVVIEAVVDPFEPPMPPKITTEQAMIFTQSLLRGEPNREKIALAVLADKVCELV